MNPLRRTPTSPPPLRVRVDGESAERSHTRTFVIGRDAEVDLRVESPRVSRRHAEVAFEDGAWWLTDLGSSNGTFHDGERVQRLRLGAHTSVQLGGAGGPVVHFGGAALAQEPETTNYFDEAPASAEAPRAGGAERMPTGTPTGLPSDREASPSLIFNHYFGQGSDQPAGERTQAIRAAYQQVQKRERRKYGGVIAAALLLLMLAMGVLVWQRHRVAQMEAQAELVFVDLKRQDLRWAEYRRVLAMEDDEEVRALIAQDAAARREAARRYAGFVEELGVHRSLTPEEREIYRTARIFNESEFSIPAGFVRAVKEKIAWWQGTAGYAQAIQRAERNGYIPVIVETMERYGLPPEFFYLALQESQFDERRAVGPATRWGIAKGIWQFIPSTARNYGLQPGPREDLRVYDPQDQRFDFPAATDAAARYLSEIYTELAQASGLLVMASYNWGEHRVISKLDRMEQNPIARARPYFDDIPANPQARNYWRFLTTYESRMPDETKDYVLKIFAAAVIGQNPRLFGFDFDNPLAPYMEVRSGSAAPAAL